MKLKALIPCRPALAASCLLIALPVAAQIIDQPLPNGGFDDGLEHWETEVSAAGSAVPGTISVVDGAALIVKGGSYHSGLSQGFEAPDGLRALRLRIVQMPQFGASGGFIPEAFDVHLTGAGGFSRVATFRLGASAAANAAAVPPGLNLGEGISLVGDQLRIPITGVDEGEWLEFAVSLVGASADIVASVIIDDVVLEIEQAGEPDRVDGCGIFHDRFQISHGVAGIARCPQGQINDTGIGFCSVASGTSCPPGQDADSGRDRLAADGLLNKLGTGEAGFDFTKLDVDGEELPLAATDWACVRDNYTGLIWEAKLDDSFNLQHYAHSYSWWNTDPDSNGGQSGTPDGGVCQGSACDTDRYVVAVNGLRLCGATDWRMPTRQELSSIVHSGTMSPHLDTAFYPLGDQPYWTATPVASDPQAAWLVDFATGAVTTDDKSISHRVRLVRGLK